MKTKTIFMVLILAAGLVLTAAFAATDAHAQSEGSILFVSPHRVDFSPDGRVETLNVANKSDITRRYDLQIIDQVMTEEGTTVRMDDFPYSAKDMLRFVPKRFTLEPGERQTVRVMVRRPAGLPDGDYHSHLLFREVPLRTQERPATATATQRGAVFEIKALYGVAVPIVVQNGAVHSAMNIGSVARGKDEHGRDVLTVRFNRSGNAEASALLSAVHRKGDGTDVPVITEQWVRIYREVDHITRNIVLRPPEGHRLSGGSILITLVKNPRTPQAEIIDTHEISLP
ncbi:MAG: hypothetical protein EA357_00350 [Micavibrio sp.]|nr:MAG: hypothetical protein EA357_00350 [Micavibrio sp.]